MGERTNVTCPLIFGRARLIDSSHHVRFGCAASAPSFCCFSFFYQNEKCLHLLMLSLCLWMKSCE